MLSLLRFLNTFIVKLVALHAKNIRNGWESSSGNSYTFTLGKTGTAMITEPDAPPKLKGADQS